ncbi:MAG TPA: GGDEF domain-containing protein [Desulfotomaculum sp.]|nr:GGDEF domain-containing protein [Desulfotomaculum sp.]
MSKSFAKEQLGGAALLSFLTGLDSSVKIKLISEILLEGILIGWVAVSVYMSLRYMRDRIMILLLSMAMSSFVVGGAANIYGNLHPLRLWEDVLLVDLAHSSGYVFLSASVGYLVHWYIRLNHVLKREATTDFLTGLCNRRHFYERLAEAVARYERYREPFGIAILDVDELKEVNDKYGHLAGDELLKELAQALKRSVRASDCVARFGGDEFAILFAGAANADGFLERFLLELEKCKVTVSTGMAFCPKDAVTADELVALADNRMYAAKAEKNRLTS